MIIKNYTGHWHIEISGQLMGYLNQDQVDRTITSLRVDDLDALPDALLQLHDMDYALSEVIDAVHQIEQKQRERQNAKLVAKLKEKALQLAEAPKSRRFVVAYAKKDAPEEYIVAEGIEYGGGRRIHVAEPWHLAGSFSTSMETYKATLEKNGESYYIHYID